MSDFKSELFIEEVIINHIKIQNMGKIEGKPLLNYYICAITNNINFNLIY